MTNIDNYKKLLLAEKKRLEVELGTVGEENPDAVDAGKEDDWDPTPPEGIEHEADPIDQADDMEEFGERIAIEGTLEEQLGQVEKALAAIEAGTYGKCTECGMEIEEGRLKANPSATTCIAHMG